MGGSHEGFGLGFPGMSGARPSGSLFDAFEQFTGMFDQRPAQRMNKGDVRQAVLALLAEEPMHGYQIIQEIEQRSGGSWKPSPGSVYPTLQLLADEGLISVTESDGRKTYALTEEGATVAPDSEEPAPWEATRKRESVLGGLPKAGANLAQAAALVARTGTQEQAERATAILDDARRKLFAILAED